MTELLVPAYPEFGSSAGRPVLDWIAPNLEVADIAARIRAQHRLRTPDALQAATAVQSHATGLVTNDAIFERVQAFETMELGGLI
jgi:predicted nucleic acid-binding protein